MSPDSNSKELEIADALSSCFRSFRSLSGACHKKGELHASVRAAR
jgi:hypothetical protein